MELEIAETYGGDLVQTLAALGGMYRQLKTILLAFKVSDGIVLVNVGPRSFSICTDDIKG